MVLPHDKSSKDESMFMALRPKPGAANWSEKTINFYSSEYQKSVSDPIVVEDKANKTLNSKPAVFKSN